MCIPLAYAETSLGTFFVLSGMETGDGTETRGTRGTKNLETGESLAARFCTYQFKEICFLSFLGSMIRICGLSWRIVRDSVKRF